MRHSGAAVLFYVSTILFMAGGWQQSAWGCSDSRKLPPLKLTGEQKRLLASANEDPKTALDYYLLLPHDYFSVLWLINGPKAPSGESRERRVTYIDLKTLTDQYLHAKLWFECDQGGFEVTIRLFDAPDGGLVGVSSRANTLRDENTMLFQAPREKRGVLSSVVVSRPSFWRYVAGGWRRVSDSILPMIPVEKVLELNRSKWHSPPEFEDQSKFITLAYELPRTGNTIIIKGRENFMDPFLEYEWGRYELKSGRFREAHSDYPSNKIADL